MMIVMNKHGDKRSNGGKAVKDYLLGKDNDRAHARVLRGNPDLTTEIINGLDFKKIYTSGTLAFAYCEGDKLSEQDKQDIIDSFEQAMFPNLEPSQYSGYWVEHTDKVLLDDQQVPQPILDKNGNLQTRLELNFVFANVELTSSKALPVYYHQNDKHLTDAWRDFTVAKYDLIDPNAVDRKRTLATVKDLPQNVKELRDQLHDFIKSEIELGNINSRTDIVQTLTDAGIEVARQTDKSISIKNPHGTRNIRLSGAIYEREFTTEKLVTDYSASTTEQSRQSSINIDDARKRLQYSIKKRADRFAARYEKRDERDVERTQKLTAHAQISDSSRADVTVRLSSSDRRQAQYSDYPAIYGKQKAYAASEHHERDTKNTALDVWNHADVDLISTHHSDLSLSNISDISNSFCNTIVHSFDSNRYSILLHNKKNEGLNEHSRAAIARNDNKGRADATLASQHSIRSARERTAHFFGEVEAEIVRHAQRANASIAVVTDDAGQKISDNRAEVFERIGRTSRRNRVSEQASRALDTAITAVERGNIRINQRLTPVAAQAIEQQVEVIQIVQQKNVRHFRM